MGLQSSFSEVLEALIGYVWDKALAKWLVYGFS